MDGCKTSHTWSFSWTNIIRLAFPPIVSNIILQGSHLHIIMTFFPTKVVLQIEVEKIAYSLLLRGRQRILSPLLSIEQAVFSESKLRLNRQSMRPTDEYRLLESLIQICLDLESMRPN